MLGQQVMIKTNVIGSSGCCMSHCVLNTTRLEDKYGQLNYIPIQLNNCDGKHDI